MSALFVTATGTEIGKTHFVERLIAHCRATGRALDVLKPVVSGFDPGDWAGSDPGRLLTALGLPLTAEALDAMSPWRFRAPLSSDLAAQRENREIPYLALLDLCRRRIAERRDVLLIEGVGGAMVPLDARHTVCDWMQALDIPAVVIGGTYLGAISHALTTLAALEARRITVRALVLSESSDNPLPACETAEVLARFAPVPVHVLARGGPAAAAMCRNLLR